MSFRRHPALLLLSTLPLLFSAHALSQDAPPPPQPESVLPSTLVENIHLQHHLFRDKTRQDIVKPLVGIARSRHQMAMDLQQRATQHGQWRSDAGPETEKRRVKSINQPR